MDQNEMKNRDLEVTLFYVTMPSDEQLVRMRAFIAEKYPDRRIIFRFEEDPEMIAGFVLRVENTEYDWSMKTRLEELRSSIIASDIDSISTEAKTDKESIISLLREEIGKATFKDDENEVGIVEQVGDGIARIRGIEHAMYGEVVLFDNGIKGMVQDIKKDSIGVILFGEDSEILAGMKVCRTEKKAGVSVGNGLLGRIVDALGAPLDGKGEIITEAYLPIEGPAPSILERQSVSEPLETGILAIDSMFPIGKGQRELIIGDRQTGKTSIALDTILNQRGKNVICIYVAISQKASSVSKFVSTLIRHQAMEYTIVVNAGASDPASLQYIAPYSGTAMAEFFMHQGKDVLIVYDDLSKHAVAYRALSLLLERSPGREAYPGDVFYLHSRLLERSARLSKKLGGGSITALPVVETQAGDVSAYIPTNVISITDGQIILESSLFFEGQRPAVNVGLSVSRVGGAAQSKAMKKAAGSIRIDLAQYREMQIFTQFASDLDDTTRARLLYGSSLMEILKQPLYHPIELSDQVLLLLAATGKQFTKIPIGLIGEMKQDYLDYMLQTHADLVQKIRSERALTDELITQIREAAQEFFSKLELFGDPI